MQPLPRFRFQLLAMSLARAIVNTGYRMIYPFLPVIARGLGVSVSAVALAVTARSSLGLAAPLLGSLADLRGRKAAMLLGLGLYAAGLSLVAVWPTYAALLIALLLSAAGKYILDPAIQAYIGDRVHYARRGLAIAVTELGWSGAFLFGIPLAGWLMARSGWQAPFPWLAALGLGGLALLWRGMPDDLGSPSRPITLSDALRTLASHGPAAAGLAFALLISAGNETVTIVYGVWLEGAFGLQVTALGIASAVLGLAELGGEGLVAGLADRLGKRRAVALGITASAAASLALPLTGRSVAGALVGLFLFYITFEFTIVSALPLMTELLPAARGTLMASSVAAFAAGRALGDLLGPPLYSIGLTANTAATVALYLAALAVLFRYVPGE